MILWKALFSTFLTQDGCYGGAFPTMSDDRLVCFPSYLRKKHRKRVFCLSLSLDICSVFILTTRALSLARFLFSSLPSRYIHIGAAKEREREITRHPSPSLALSFSLCVRVVPEHKKKKKKKKKRIKISVKKKSIINRLLITRMSSARPPLSMKQPMLVGSDNEDEEGVTTPTTSQSGGGGGGSRRFSFRRSSEDGVNIKSSFRDRLSSSFARTSRDEENEGESEFGSETSGEKKHRGRESGKYSEPNEEERKRMEYLREQLVKHDMELPKTMKIPELGGEERTLLRFVRARTKGKELAWEMLRNT